VWIKDSELAERPAPQVDGATLHAAVFARR
jgi:hypothetical protein